MSESEHTCRYHCREGRNGCGAHFASLEAFDAHREGPAGSHRTCTFPEDSGLVETTGVCEIGDPSKPRVGVTIYSTERAARAGEYFAATSRPRNTLQRAVSLAQTLSRPPGTF